MYSVVEFKGHQYKLQAGDIVDVERVDQEIGTDIELDQVLFVGGETPQIGAPTVAGAKVKARLIKEGRSEKILVFKRKRRSGRRARRGHRQEYSALLITEVIDGNGNSTKIDAKSKEAEKYLK